MKLSINNISFKYDSKVLDNITFSVKKGSFLGIIGPNGSGKTTLLKIISNILKPATGAVFINDKAINSMNNKEIAKQMGVVLQHQGIYPFTAYEVVLMGRIPHLTCFQNETIGDFKIVQSMMQITGIWKFKNKLITELSGGEKQKVIIARALAQEPGVLLLDEPTTHLDIHHQIAILDILKDLSREGITIVSVFHDLNMAAKYCDSLIFMNSGKVISAGTPEVVLTQENIKSVFGIFASVNRHPLTNSIYIIPHNSKKNLNKISENKINKNKNKKIHVIGGGGAAMETLHALFDSGYCITAGVLNVMDSDYETAKSLGIEIVSEAPFSGITHENYMKNIEFIKNSDFVVIENIYIGNGNMENLEAVMDAGCKVVIIERSPVDERDFTDGSGRKIYSRLRKNAIVVKDTKECLEVL